MGSGFQASLETISPNTSTITMFKLKLIISNSNIYCLRPTFQNVSLYYDTTYQIQALSLLNLNELTEIKNCVGKNVLVVFSESYFRRDQSVMQCCKKPDWLNNDGSIRFI